MLCCLLAAMQILASNFDSQKPQCPTCRRGLHRHGRYARQVQTRKETIPRWLCPRCCKTFSILPRGLLPYRRLSCLELQEAFDRWAFDGQPPRTKPSLAALESWQDPLLRKGLQHVCGQLLNATLESGQALWQGLRRCFSSVQRLVEWMAAHYDRSLLGRYVCQGMYGWSRPRPSGNSVAPFQLSIPHTFSALNPSSGVAGVR